MKILFCLSINLIVIYNIEVKGQGITNLESKSDTSIIVLPDFYVEKVNMPDSNYNYSNVICFKAGHLVSTHIDSIIECECRIYPSKNANSKIRMRRLWVANRIDSTHWKKAYYDNDNKIIIEYLIEEIRPFEFLEPNIVKKSSIHTTRDEPSIIMYKYYRTNPKNNR